MAKLIRARLLLLLLCTLVLGFQAALAQTTDFSLPPEDLDSSGDDDDSFSGSGAGSLSSVTAWDVPQQESINTSTSPSVTPHVEDHLPEAQGTETPSEDHQRIPVSPTNMHVFLVNDLITDKPEESPDEESVDEEVGVFTEQVTTSSPVLTTRVPVTHHTHLYASTPRITTSHASSTIGILHPVVYHGLSSNDKEEAAANDIEPTINSWDGTSSTTTSLVLITGTSRPEEDIYSPEDGSGNNLEDFVFGGTDEKIDNRAVEELGTENSVPGPGARDTKSAGASQGLMDRKDVLAGVIAGGLVGLLFAGFLVGFMLYRMKKKDEGSYSLDEPKQSNGGYQKPHKQEEFYA